MCINGLQPLTVTLHKRFVCEYPTIVVCSAESASKNDKLLPTPDETHAMHNNWMKV